MGVDLKSNSFFKRISIVLMDDSLVTLEHERTQDRSRRIMFDRIESVVVWRSIPWVRIVLIGLLIVLPAASILFIGRLTSTIIGTMFLAFGLAVILWYFYCRHTILRIMRAGQAHDISGIYRPGRFRPFRDRLISNIRNSQQVMVDSSGAMPPATPPIDSTLTDPGTESI